MKNLFVVFFILFFVIVSTNVVNAQEEQNQYKTNVIEMSKNDIQETSNATKYDNAIKNENIRKDSDYNFKNIEMNKFNIQLIQPNFYMNRQ